MVCVPSAREVCELTVDQAIAATQIVTRCGVTKATEANWNQMVRGFTPAEFLLVWNEVQADVTQRAGPNALVTRIRLLSDKSIQVECRDLDVC